jgi:hypothetical protein
MVEDTVTKDMKAERPSLKKHTYPLLMRCFGFLLLFIFLYVIPHFMFHELPYHYQMKNYIKEAEHYFLHQKYVNALELYLLILEKYPDYRPAKIRIAESYFALSSQRRDLYYIGLSYLRGEIFKNEELKTIETFLHAAYREHFRQQFTPRRSFKTI